MPRTNSLSMTTYRTHELMMAGIDARQIRSGAHDVGTQIRHGGYQLGAPPRDHLERHQSLIATTWPLLGDDAVLSHFSAGLQWQLPVDRKHLERVHITRGRRSGGRTTPNLHVHVRSLPEQDLTEFNGYRVTSLARSAADLARASKPPQALAVMDAALRATDGERLAEAVRRDGRRHGIAQARWALQAANPLAESPAESISRYWMLMGGIPEPVLQYEVRNAQGALVGRADFAWPELGVLGEFDGRIKYGELVRPDETPTDVVMREKQREVELRALGWWVIRWTWRELMLGVGFANWLRTALANAPAVAALR